MGELVSSARAGGYAVGAFSASNMEMVMGVVTAAEALRAPVILQVAEKRLGHSPLWALAPVMIAAAQRSSVPVAVQLDHGRSMDAILTALRAGFTSVMYDGSALPLEKNMEMTRRVVEAARAFGASAEAEVGRVGSAGDAAGQVAGEEECVQFAREAGADALAVAIGNAHGVYPVAPKLDFALVERLRARITTPLVLHGGTGIPDADIRRLIGLGMAKINIATELFLAADAAYRAEADDLFGRMDRVVREVRDAAARYMALFGCAGRV
jgi:fructose-bisphosphate aldolase class II